MLLKKTQQLDSYDIDGKWKSYSKGLIPILQEFLETYKNKPDVEFWNHIMDFEKGIFGSGYTGNDRISGWILKLYYDRHNIKSCDFNEILNEIFSIPIKVVNEKTKEVRMMSLLGGFTGMYYENDTFRPQISISICENKMSDKPNDDKNDFEKNDKIEEYYLEKYQNDYKEIKTSIYQYKKN